MGLTQSGISPKNEEERNWNSMKITFGGSRGSRPLHDKKFARFGGATTSVLVQGEAGELIVIDCGSGVATIEADIMASNEPVLILFTHLKPPS